MKNISLSGLLASGIKKGAGLLRGVGRRVLVHTCAILTAGFVGLALGDASLLNTFGVKFSIYIGLICLFPRGEAREPSWRLPTATGVAQGIVLLALGFAWPLAFFWSGLQTWLQRLAQSKGSLGWEWAVSPMLVICLFDFFEKAAAMNLTVWPLWSVPVLALAGWLGRAVHARLRAESIHRKMLENALQRLRTLASGRALPAAMQQQVELLLVQGEAYGKAARETESDGYAAIERLDGLSRELQIFAAAPSPAASGWPQTLLRSKRWSSTGQAAPAEDKILCSARELNAFLLEALRDAQAAAPSGTLPDAAKGAPGHMDGRMQAYEESARQLLHKKDALPENSARHVEGIALSAFNIVRSMRADPQDRAPGDRFLGRYLKAAHRIVDEYVRLADENAPQKDVSAALARSGEILARLEQAFKDEHAGMLQNDAVNYTAELNALDTLLKMRGH